MPRRIRRVFEREAAPVACAWARLLIGIAAAAIVAPARGCIDAFDIIRAQTCAIASAALLDAGSHNTYGVKTAPDPATDGVCTNDPLESRVFVQGTGSVRNLWTIPQVWA